MRIRDLSNGAEQTLNTIVQDIAYVHSWTPDGKFLITNVQEPKTLFDIYAQPVDGGDPAPLLTQSYDERSGDVSPNGRWMAYLSDESGRNELYVTNFPQAHSKIQISTEGAGWHCWSRDGKQLYFSNGDKLMATDIRNPETLELGSTALIATFNDEPLGFGNDGRLLVLKSVKGQQAEPLRIVTHFTETLGK
jgi:Tol biopolymer transport system component